MPPHPVIVIGAGLGGLAASLALAARGLPVQVFERQPVAGGKAHQVRIGAAEIDSGPTVFTLREVFDALFAASGSRLEDHLRLRQASLLARHAWGDGARLDLFADPQRSAAAIGALSGPAEARRFEAFARRAAATYSALEGPFLRAQQPGPLGLTGRLLAHRPSGLAHIHPFGSLWRALQGQFRDPRLQQLFGRYATYCGSSPFLAPATLMLIAHVEQRGVWTLDGGMGALVGALQQLAEARGVTFHFNETVTGLGLQRGRLSHVETAAGGRHRCSAAICNADPAALRAGLFGDAARAALPARGPGERSLSALTWTGLASPAGFPLSHHNVFFSGDYRREFQELLQEHRLPSEPTVYLCAQDRPASEAARSPGAPERLLCLVNAPAIGDHHTFTPREVEACGQRVRAQLARCGLALNLDPARCRVSTPTDFARRFPASGGALYGSPSHGWRASFSRPRARSRIPGLYLAGGGVHPGPGLPMAALSGCLAADLVLRDLTSRFRWPTAATAGGISTPRVTTANTR
jgi:1-hydroxycarotenoid 3,4-desaturase